MASRGDGIYAMRLAVRDALGLEDEDPVIGTVAPAAQPMAGPRRRARH